MPRYGVWLLPLVLILFGCSEPEIVDGSSDAVLTGVVTRASGLPLASAEVSVVVVDSATGDIIFNEIAGFTDATGHFTRTLAAFLVAPFTGRVQITVRPVDALPDTTLDAGFLRFGLQPPATSNTEITYP